MTYHHNTPHLSHLERGRISREREDAIDRVLSRFEAHVNVVRRPLPPRVWISSPNCGQPANRAREEEMEAALREAGLYPLVK